MLMIDLDRILTRLPVTTDGSSIMSGYRLCCEAICRIDSVVHLTFASIPEPTSDSFTKSIESLRHLLKTSTDDWYRQSRLLCSSLAFSLVGHGSTVVDTICCFRDCMLD